MEVSLTSQTNGFFFSCAVGFALGLLFDLFRVIRAMLLCGKISVFFQDVFFAFCAGTATFLTALAVNDGELRFYIAAGEIIGACVYFLTIGEVTLRFARGLRKCGRTLKKRIGMPVYKIFRSFWLKWKKNWRRNQKKIPQRAKTA